MSRSGIFRDSIGALRVAASDIRSGWTRRASLTVLLFAVAAAVPLAVSDPVRLGSLASGLFVVLAAIALNFVLGLADMPSLGHGAFVGVGAFTAALLRVKADWAFFPSTLSGVVVAGVVGLLVGVGVVRLRGAALAAATWIMAWLFAFVLGAFPSVFGGSQGLVIPEAVLRLAALRISFRMTPLIYLEVGLVLVALSLLAFRSIARSQTGYALTAVRQGPSAAAAVGADSYRLQLGVFGASAALAGAAGALTVQLGGIADPTSFGPLRSVVLFAAVMLGGAGTLWGPVLGAAALGVIPLAAEALGDALGTAPERFEPLIAGVLLLAALVLGRGGLVRSLSRGDRKVGALEEPLSRRMDTGAVAPMTFAPITEHKGGAILEARNLTKTFGGVTALADVSMRLEGGKVHALIGPNGSGKTTCMRTLAGTIASDGGEVYLGGHPLGMSTPAERLDLGLARTLQRTEVFPDMTVLEHVLLGARVRQNYGGPWRTVFSTPKARREAKASGQRGEEILSAVGLGWARDLASRELSSGDQRLLMVAMACSSSPRVLLLDEPSAGMSHAYVDRLRNLIGKLRDDGVTLLLVEHNLRLVGEVADGVTVLSAGQVIAEGTPSEVASDPVVVGTYLGSSRM